jgi:glycosyltransferase involved in cell wall biosynthesis
MKILILTQKVDAKDPVLGFFCRWIRQFASQADEVKVICLYKGEYDLPLNVKVYSLGKESGQSRIKYVYRLLKYSWDFRNEYDIVFVHMNQIYVNICGLLWKALGKKIGLWYAHGAVSGSLKLALALSDIVFTSTKEGFRIPSSKVTVVGQGIDTEYFTLKSAEQAEKKPFEIIYFGRISPVKKIEHLLEAVALVKDRIDLVVNIIGPAESMEQKNYLSKIKSLTHTLGIANRVTFIGGVPNDEIVGWLKRADVFVNPSQTGSLDKTGLEAMACGVPVLTSNEAYSSVIGKFQDRLFYQKDSVEDMSLKIASLAFSQDLPILGMQLRDIVVREHGVRQLISRILEKYQE